MQVNPGDLDGEYDIEIDIGVSPSEKQSIANQLDLLVQFATQAGLQMGIQEPLDVLRVQIKKYRVLGINVNNLFLSEADFKKKQAIQQQQMMQQQAVQQSGQQQGQPPKGPSETISFKDLPPDGQVQMAAQAGIKLTPQGIMQNQQQQVGTQGIPLGSPPPNGGIPSP